MKRPAAQPARPGQRILAGILFMCGAGLLFPIMSGFAKFLGADYNTLQISWARAFGHIVFMLTRPAASVRNERPSARWPAASP